MARVTVSLNYTAPLDLYRSEKPYFSNVPAPDGKQSNQVTRTYDGVEVTDIHTIVDRFDIDKHGFEIVKFGKEDVPGNFDSDEWIETAYYPVVKAVLQARLGNVQTHIFDHTVRKRKTVAQMAGASQDEHSRQPSFSAHCDQTFLSGENRVKLHMGDQATNLLKGRCQIINVWRPLFGPLEDCPLTYCDWNTIDVSRDLMPADLIFPHYIGEQYLVTHHPDHRWYFLSGQRTNQFTLLKCWDNDIDAARCTPHTSFLNPNAPEGARLRESVEFRCLVFYQEQSIPQY